MSEPVYWWQLFAWIAVRESCFARVEWTKREPGYWGRPLVVEGSSPRALEYHEGALARMGKEPYDGSIKYPVPVAPMLSLPSVRFVPRGELQAMYPEPKRKRPRWGKRRVR